MKEEIGYTVTGDDGKFVTSLRKALLEDHNPILMAIKANPKCDTLIINDKDWGRLDIGLVLEISKRVNVQPTSVIDEGKSYLFRKKDLEIDWLKNPFEPLV